MADTLFNFAVMEIYPDHESAVAAMQSRADDRIDADPSLFALSAADGVTVIGGVTLIRPDDVAIRDESVLTRPGQRYRDLVRHLGHQRLVIDLAGLRPFGHPFHDDIFSILRELGGVGGRLAICGAATWYTERLPMYRRLVQVTVCGRGGTAGASSQSS